MQQLCNCNCASLVQYDWYIGARYSQSPLWKTCLMGHRCITVNIWAFCQKLQWYGCFFSPCPWPEGAQPHTYLESNWPYLRFSIKQKLANIVFKKNLTVTGFLPNPSLIIPVVPPSPHKMCSLQYVRWQIRERLVRQVDLARGGVNILGRAAAQ